MIMMSPWVLGAVVFFVAFNGVALFLAIRRLRNLEQRYVAFREQCTVMIASHQDVLHNHEGRLQRLGSPSAGRYVPSTDEMLIREREG
jgi:hypothetical protein